MADLQHHLSGNVEQYVQRIKMHDDVDAPRRVEHFAEFRRLADAQAAATTLERAGWAVRVERRRITQGRLIAARTTTVDVETADRCTEEVFAAVAEHRGRYEGWNAPVLRSL
ncbi:regulator of ribonuclease activity B [Microcella putealis]|uniref:Regulator of ribonuclease activity B n=1 Tax=Microcella putealis TaxID=337005 RepID=A0A4Q7LXH8_9MICO|nr:ribonuclease E inhibitor RraB [Microcella putealis]RZS59735.1 regulator of ribonuclease activity B [Microcella putealis]TQM26848.1 regulator of ribonuclease activity B [Microcella putealis]